MKKEKNKKRKRKTPNYLRIPSGGGEEELLPPQTVLRSCPVGSIAPSTIGMMMNMRTPINAPMNIEVAQTDAL
ncbi:MAG: hypothetical protein GY852_09155, partial [bacterium]|nr:hypothetical protein [bacterium]